MTVSSISVADGVVVVDDYWNANGGLNADPANGISHRWIHKVRDGGADIDGRRLIGTTRNFNKTSAEFSINSTSRGNNVLALSESDDLNNQTLEATVAGWTTITNLTEGYNGIDVSGDGSDEFYYAEWDLGAQSINDLYERAKWIQREGSAETIYGLPGELFRGITHEGNITSPTGTFSEPEALSWSGGTGQLLAIDSPTAGTTFWMQLLTGSPPADTDVITGGTSGATATMSGSTTERSVSSPFVGASTGSAIIGAFGLGIQNTDLSASNTLFDLTNASITPPNNVTFTVSGLVVGEDRVLVGPETAGGLDKAQLSLSAGLSGAAETSVVVGASIPTDTPASGTIRVVNNDGLDVLCTYTSYSGSTFTIDPTDFSGVGASAANNVYITYIDKLAAATSESFTGVFAAPRSLFIRVRDGAGTPIKTFETTGTLGSAGGSTTVIRTSDE